MPKTIFNTTEKSNFILNLKTEEYHRFNLRILLSFFVLMPVFSLPLEFSKVYSVPGMALAITGVFAMVFVFIGFMKLATPKRLWLPAGILGAMVIWGIVSMINSYYYTFPSTALFGADGRSEGLLSLVFYGCFFLLGAQLGSNRHKLMNGMLLMGLAECVWALLQSIGIPSYYENLEPLLLFRVFLPSGLTGSPIFLATLLVMLEFPALLGAVFAEEKKERILCLISAVVFALFSVRTQCLIGICGMALAIVSAMVCALIRKGGKAALLKSAAAVLAFAAGLGWCLLAPQLYGTYTRANGTDEPVSSGLALYDGAIMWEDSSYRLAASGYYIAHDTNNPNGHFDINDIGESYGYLWDNTVDIIREFPLVGTGPDCLVYPQMYQNMQIGSNPNVFDRAYNYYLHIAATMGIPMLVLFVVLMGITLLRGFRVAGKGSDWLTVGMLGGVVLYLLVMCIGSSCVTVAPLFWMLAGCCAGAEPAKAAA